MKADRYIGLILFVFSIFMYPQTFKFPPAMLGTLGAGFFPQILFALLGLAGLGLIVDSFWQNKQTLPAKHSSFIENLHAHSLVILSFVLVFIYIVAMYYFGFLWATLGFMMVGMWLLGPRKMKALPLIIIVSCGLTFIIYFSFLKLLQIFLPEGVVF